MNKSNSMSNMTALTVASSANSLSLSTNTATSLTTAASLSSMFAPTPGALVAAADIQAQFELSVELRRFINIDLFQRGYYQIRVSVRIGNKQVLNKVSIKLENAKSNKNLSDVMFPSCVGDEFAISKTFLILYRNEEVLLDDHFVFKVDAMVNAFNLVESFDKLDLQLSIELWFTENDYIPMQQQQQQQQSSTAATTTTTTTLTPNMSTSTNLNNAQSQQQPAAPSSTPMQLLCARLYKVHFDPRQGVHLQMPVTFDYFHLSAVLVTLHCFLLTLLPPVLVGPNSRNSTLAAILFGKDLAQFQSTTEITPPLMRRAVHLHQQICHLLLTSYENLQDHVMTMTSYLNEYDRKKITLEFVNCHEKLSKLTQIIQACYEAEALDDMANRHVAQCSAENIMLWCLYLEHFSLNQTTSPYLASEYHTKRLKRFSESFFVKDVPRRAIQDYELTESYVALNDMIRQTAYYQQIPELVVACDDLDGTARNLPIIFEDHYVYSTAAAPHSSASSDASSRSVSSATFAPPILKDPASIMSNHSSPLLHNGGSAMTLSFNSKTSSVGLGSAHQWSSMSSRLDSTTAVASPDSQSLAVKMASKFVASKKLHKKTNNEDIFALAEKSSITLTSYKKTDNYFSDSPATCSLDSSPSTPPLVTPPTPSPPPPAPPPPPPQTASVESRGSLRRSLHIKSASHKDYLLQRQQSQRTLPVTTAADSGVSTTATDDSASVSSAAAEQIPPVVDASVAAPNDGSAKSRALYESFRGKINTLERPRRVRRSLNNSVSSSGAAAAPPSSNAVAAAASAAVAASAALCSSSESRKDSTSSAGGGGKQHKHHHHHHHHHNQNNTRHGSIDATPVGTGAAASSCANKMGALSLVAAAGTTTPTSSVQKLDAIKRPHQLSIQTDPNSLSCVLNETLYRFVIVREELKRALSLKYHGNIYSEYSTLFSTTPYFYPELMPKFALLNGSNGLHQQPPPQQQQQEATQQAKAKNGRGSSFMSSIRSKGKLFKLFKKSTDSTASSSEPASAAAAAPPPTMNHNNEQTPPPAAAATASSHSSRSDSVSSSGDSACSSSDEDDDVLDADEKLHLVICVHGLDGNSGDLRLLRTYLELALPGARMDFLMSEQNQDSTFEDIEMMTKHLIKEIRDYMDTFGIEPGRISFIGHSLGNLIIRSTVSHADFAPFAPKLYTYLSLSGPHLGTLYNPSGLVNMGMWLMQKWKKSGSLLQLSLKDNSDPCKTFLYKLSRKPTFELFKNVLLVASPQDRYVPFHSAHLQLCKSASKDNSLMGQVYRDMVANILKPLQESPHTFVRYSAFHTLPSDTSNFIGRAAHIAVLDSELFVEKLILVSVAKYFR